METMALPNDGQSVLCRKVFVGGLGANATKQEIETAFGYFGPLQRVWVAHNPPGFAFVEFEVSRDAEDSVAALDGTMLCGRHVQVEMSNVRHKDDTKSNVQPRQQQQPMRNYFPQSHAPLSHPNVRCATCQQTGHYARNCPAARFRSNGNRRSRSPPHSSSSASPYYARSSYYGRKNRSRSRSPRRPRHSRSRNRTRSRSRSSDEGPSRRVADQEGCVTSKVAVEYIQKLKIFFLIKDDIIGLQMAEDIQNHIEGIAQQEKAQQKKISDYFNKQV